MSMHNWACILLKSDALWELMGAVVKKDICNLYLSIKIESHPNYSSSKQIHPSPKFYMPNNPGS